MTEGVPALEANLKVAPWPTSDRNGCDAACRSRPVVEGGSPLGGSVQGEAVGSRRCSTAVGSRAGGGGGAGGAGGGACGGGGWRGRAPPGCRGGAVRGRGTGRSMVSSADTSSDG